MPLHKHAPAATALAREQTSIPATMATRHPDHASRPFFATQEPLSAADKVKETIIALRDMGCQEYLWDWQGTFLDETLVDRLYEDYAEYFRTKQLGRDVFITFHIPRISEESFTNARRAYATIVHASDTSRDLGLHVPAIFEVAIPLLSRPEKMLHVVSSYNNTVATASDWLHRDCKPKLINMIPCIEDLDQFFQSLTSIREFIALYQSTFRCKIDYIRPMLNRSTVAFEAGLIPAALCTKVCLTNYAQFEKEAGLKVYPIITAGSSAFRGGLCPDTIHRFLTQYPGVRTVTVQSAFRYDHDWQLVKSAVKKLNLQVPKTKTQLLNPNTIKECAALCQLFFAFYKKTVKNITPTLLEFSSHLPSRWEPATSTEGNRKQKIELQTFPKPLDSLKFSAASYSLGIPPELIGTGRGLLATIRAGKIKTLEAVYPTLKEELASAGQYFNKENLSLLCNLNDAWRDIKKDISLIEDYLGTSLGPTTTSQVLHRNHTSNVFHLWQVKKSMQEDLGKAAQLRRFLG